MRKLVTSILMAGALLLCAQGLDQPDRVLFKGGVGQEQAGRLNGAKLCFTTLVRTYYDSPVLPQAKAEIGAIYIYEEAQAKQTAGDLRGAFDTYRTLVIAYRESALSASAAQQMRVIDPEGKWTRR
jgi:hypothetical protein